MMGARPDVALRMDGDIKMHRLRVCAVAGRGSAMDDGIETLSYPDVILLDYDEFLAQHDPIAVDVVLAPMVGDRFDCIDVAQHLARTGFRGQFRVMAPMLPRPGVLRSEVRALFPGLDVDIVVPDPTRDIPRA